MKVDVHLLTYNEQRILPFTLLHYRQFASRIFVHDGGSTDNTLTIAKHFGCHVLSSASSGELNDAHHAHLKSTAWRGTDADWVIMADADELIHFAELPPFQALALMERYSVWVAKPHGWELFSREFPVFDGHAQIYDLVRYGAPDMKWYSKPILFSPKGVDAIEFQVGAHGLRWVRYKDPNMRDNVPIYPTKPDVFLLHCKHLGPIDDITARYELNQSRLAPINRQRKWGTIDNPAAHAKEKRDRILANLSYLPFPPSDHSRVFDNSNAQVSQQHP